MSDPDWAPPSELRGAAGDLTDAQRRLDTLVIVVRGLFDDCASPDVRDATADALAAAPKRFDSSAYRELNCLEWCFFLHLHTSAHLSQVRALKALPGFPPRSLGPAGR